MRWPTLLLLIYLMLIGLVILAAFLGPRLWERFTEWRDRRSYESANLLAETAVALLVEYPEEWEVGSYRLEHPKTGMSIWIANAYRRLPYLKITVDGCEMLPDFRHRKQIYDAFRQMAAGRAARRVRDGLARVRDRLRVYEGGKA